MRGDSYFFPYARHRFCLSAATVADQHGRASLEWAQDGPGSGLGPCTQVPASLPRAGAGGSNRKEPPQPHCAPRVAGCVLWAKQIRPIGQIFPHSDLDLELCKFLVTLLLFSKLLMTLAALFFSTAVRPYSVLIPMQ